MILLLPALGYGQGNTSNIYDKYLKALEKGNIKKAHRELLKISEVQTNTYIHYMTLGNFHGDQENLDSAVLYLGAALDYNCPQPVSVNQEGYFEFK